MRNNEIVQKQGDHALPSIRSIFAYFASFDVFAIKKYDVFAIKWLSGAFFTGSGSSTTTTITGVTVNTDWAGETHLTF